MERDPEQRVVEEFTHQAAAFNKSPVMNMAQTLDDLVAMLPVAPEQRWLEVACGPGIVTRALAPRVGEVVGVDLTPAMVELAQREAADAGVHNARFVVGDATALPWPAGEFAGAVTRFSLHHMPEPERALAEMVRVVKPGGWVAVADHLSAEDPDTARWHQELERLRDPSHQNCLTPAQLRALAAELGLTPEVQYIAPMIIDYGEWLNRGSGGAANQERTQALLASRPQDASFAVTGEPGARRLHLTLGRFLWRKP